MNRARLLIAEDHDDIRELLAEMLRPDYEIVALVSNGQAAVEAATAFEPDLALLDISMPVMNGITAARRMKLLPRAAKIVFISNHTDAAYVEAAFRLGACGYVFKTFMGTELTIAIREVLAGGIYRSPKLAEDASNGPH
jgi:DNA-binding NarL/FixJ family response regulator